jgi:P pilus assembly chaperone PapD
MDVQPTINIIQLPRDNGGIRVAVRNPRTVSLPVTFEVVERTINPDGTETQTPADDLFTIFPNQANIAPGKTQAVRVQFAGTATNKSRSFTLYAVEVPVDMSQSGQTGVQRILRIGASVHVTTATTRPKPVLEAAAAASNGTKVTIRNDGDRFVYIDALSLDFGSKKVEGTALADIAGRTLITPGAKREFVIPGVSGQPSLKVIGPIL